MRTEIQYTQLKKTLPGERGSAKCTPLPDPGAVNPDPGGAYFMNNARKFIKDNFETSCGLGLSRSSGVYAIFAVNLRLWQNCSIWSEHLLYIGSSKNIERRVYSDNHPYVVAYLRFKKQFPDFSVKAKWIETDNYLQLEKELIRSLRPPLNKHQYQKGGTK